MTLRLPLSLLLLGLVVGCADPGPTPDWKKPPPPGVKRRYNPSSPGWDPVQGKKRPPVEAPDAPAD